MTRLQSSRRPILSALAGLLLLVPSALSVSADSDEVAGALANPAPAMTQPAPALAPAGQTLSAPSPSRPVVTRTNVGWEIDTGGSSIYLDRFVDDGD